MIPALDRIATLTSSDIFLNIYIYIFFFRKLYIYYNCQCIKIKNGFLYCFRLSVDILTCHRFDINIRIERSGRLHNIIYDAGTITNDYRTRPLQKKYNVLRFYFFFFHNVGYSHWRAICIIIIIIYYCEFPVYAGAGSAEK